jgi:anthranilate synthase component 2
MKVLLVDNYDSFTYNLVHYLGELGAEVMVRRNDALSADDALKLGAEAIVLSPGPCDPDRAGICLDLIKAAAGKVPLLGVCLGHQAIGQLFGGKVVRAALPMHGKTSRVTHDGKDIFEGIPSPFIATRYHSLVVDRATFPAALEIAAETAPDNIDGGINGSLVMALRHRQHPIYGVQFHPESIASEHGHKLLGNFLAIAKDPRRRKAA